MSVSLVEREQASTETLAFYDKSEERFQALLNIFKVFGHQPEYGTAFTDLIMAILKDGVLDWKTKELLILKATQRNQCQYCVVQHERVSDMLGIAPEKIADLEGDKYKTSPHFTDGEKALLDLTVSQLKEGHTRASTSLLKAQIGRAGRSIGDSAIQLHGGMGMTDELNIGHYFKRLTMIDTLFGNVDFHLKRYTELDRV